MYIHVSTPHVELQRIGGRSTAGINEKKKNAFVEMLNEKRADGNGLLI